MSWCIIVNLALLITCLHCISAHASGLESEPVDGSSCTVVRFTCTMNVASAVFFAQVGCLQASCGSETSDSKMSDAILSFFELSEGLHDQRDLRRKRIRQARRHSPASSSDSSGCLICPEPTLESIHWQASGAGGSTVIATSVSFPPEDAQHFSDFLDANVLSLNSVLEEGGLPVCSKIDVTCCKHEGTMDLRIGHIFVVLVCSAAGSAIPFTPFSKMRDIMFAFRALSAGIILGLAFAHIVPESFELNKKTAYGSLNGVFIMIGIFLTFAGERLGLELQTNTCGTSEILMEPSGEGKRPPMPVAGIVVISNRQEASISTSRESSPDGAVQVAVARTDSTIPDAISKSALRKVVTAHSIELGFLVHTVLLGIDVGMWEENRASLVAFTVAMGFHQFFEGVGLGVYIHGAGQGISTCRRVLMLTTFALSFPLSICIGIGLSHSVVDEALKGWITGSINSAAGGILIYTGLVSFLAEDFLQSDYVTRSDKWLLRLQMMGALGVGMLAMSIIGIWG